MRTNYWIASLVSFGLIATASAQHPPVSDQPASAVTREGAPDTSQAKSVTPEAFAAQAAQISAAEIELGRLALDRAESAQVRQYAKKMIGEHSAQTEKLSKLAAEQRIALPSEPGPQHQALKQKLSGLQGPQFDQEYAKAMQAGHEDAVALFESASQAPQLPGPLKEFAAANLTKLKEHRDMASALSHSH